jgi:hypothetical protein
LQLGASVCLSIPGKSIRDADPTNGKPVGVEILILVEILLADPLVMQIHCVEAASTTQEEIRRLKSQPNMAPPEMHSAYRRLASELRLAGKRSEGQSAN